MKKFLLERDNHPRANAITSIAVDSSSGGIGTQLEQLNDGMWVPIAFISRKLSITGTKLQCIRQKTICNLRSNP